jgi:hypothetical protein
LVSQPKRVLKTTTALNTTSQVVVSKLRWQETPQTPTASTFASHAAIKPQILLLVALGIRAQPALMEPTLRSHSALATVALLIRSTGVTILDLMGAAAQRLEFCLRRGTAAALAPLVAA